MASAGATGVLIVVPAAVAADNCSSLGDCFVTAAGAGAAAVGAAAAAIGGFFSDGRWFPEYSSSTGRAYGPAIDLDEASRWDPPEGPPVAPGTHDDGFVFAGPDGSIRDSPSADGTVVGEAPSGSRLHYDDVVRDASGAPTHYHVNLPGGSSGYLPAGDTYDSRPPSPPPLPILDRDLGGPRPARVSATHAVAARG